VFHVLCTMHYSCYFNFSSIWRIFTSMYNIILCTTLTLMTFYVLCVCHFQLRFKLIMIFWPNKLFFYLFISINWCRQFWLTYLIFLIFIFLFPKYTLMMASFLFYCLYPHHCFSAWVSGIGCPACALRL
jgi:hypothetical protein